MIRRADSTFGAAHLPHAQSSEETSAPSNATVGQGQDALAPAPGCDGHASPQPLSGVPVSPRPASQTFSSTKPLRPFERTTLLDLPEETIREVLRLAHQDGEALPKMAYVNRAMLKVAQDMPELPRQQMILEKALYMKTGADYLAALKAYLPAVRLRSVSLALPDDMSTPDLKTLAPLLRGALQRPKVTTSMDPEALRTQLGSDASAFYINTREGYLGAERVLQHVIASSGTGEACVLAIRQHLDTARLASVPLELPGIMSVQHLIAVAHLLAGSAQRPFVMEDWRRRNIEIDLGPYATRFDLDWHGWHLRKALTEQANQIRHHSRRLMQSYSGALMRF